MVSHEDWRQSLDAQRNAASGADASHQINNLDNIRDTRRNTQELAAATLNGISDQDRPQSAHEAPTTYDLTSSPNRTSIQQLQAPNIVQAASQLHPLTPETDIHAPERQGAPQHAFTPQSTADTAGSSPTQTATSTAEQDSRPTKEKPNYVTVLKNTQSAVSTSTGTQFAVYIHRPRPIPEGLPRDYHIRWYRTSECQQTSAGTKARAKEIGLDVDCHPGNPDWEDLCKIAAETSEHLYTISGEARSISSWGSFRDLLSTEKGSLARLINKQISSLDLRKQALARVGLPSTHVELRREIGGDYTGGSGTKKASKDTPRGFKRSGTSPPQGTPSFTKRNIQGSYHMTEQGSPHAIGAGPLPRTPASFSSSLGFGQSHGVPTGYGNLPQSFSAIGGSNLPNDNHRKISESLYHASCLPGYLDEQANARSTVRSIMQLFNPEGDATTASNIAANLALALMEEFVAEEDQEAMMEKLGGRDQQ